AKWEKTLGPNHPMILAVMCNLGGALLSQGKLKEAGQILQEALKRYDKTLGPKHETTLDMRPSLP
ncbi:hypothetical protein K470DRAFT_210075, partial [Piedraia hortae CBS 480.64]